MKQKIAIKSRNGAFDLDLELFVAHFNDWEAKTDTPLQALFFSVLRIISLAAGVARCFTSFGAVKAFLIVGAKLIEW